MSSSLRAVVLAAAVAGAPSLEASVIWEGQTSRGSANFEGVELQPGRFGVVSDPRGQMGNVFYCETYDGHPDYPTGKQRCEVKGTKLPDGTIWRMSENNEYYVGWRSMWDPMPTRSGAWIAFMQLKGTGSCHLQPPGGAGCAAVIRTLGDGKLVAHLTCDGNYVIWETAMPPRGSWNSFVWRWRLGRSLSSGWVELWYNGVQQSFNGPRGNGTMRQPAALWECEAQRLKFGVYRSGALNGSGTARAHLWRPRVGTTYADVAPEGGGTTPTPTPTATPATPTPTPTNTPGGVFTEITPSTSGVTASTSDANVPGNTVDNDLATRWSGNGDGTWLQYDLGSERTVAFVKVAVYQGNARRNRFDIQVATTLGQWTTVRSAESSGTTTAEETYDFDDVSARWVRYLGHGNIGSSNTSMNSVTEVSTYTPNTVTPTPTATPIVPPTPTPTTPVGPVELTPVGAAVTASTNDGNVPANTVDKNLATRWSGNGDGAWIQYDLGATRTVTSVHVAWYQGNTRVSTFDVLTSDAPTGPWTTLAAGRTSSGTTTALETHDVPDGAGRHVRIVGHGNTLNAWNSITEVQIWGVP